MSIHAAGSRAVHCKIKPTGRTQHYLRQKYQAPAGCPQAAAARKTACPPANRIGPNVSVAAGCNGAIHESVQRAYPAVKNFEIHNRWMRRHVRQKWGKRFFSRQVRVQASHAHSRMFQQRAPLSVCIRGDVCLHNSELWRDEQKVGDARTARCAEFPAQDAQDAQRSRVFAQRFRQGLRRDFFCGVGRTPHALGHVQLLDGARR